MKILVTGGCGFIGTHLCRHLLADGHSVVNYDKLTYAANKDAAEALAEGCYGFGYTLIEGDVKHQYALLEVLREHRPDAVMHLAAESHVGRSISRPHDFMQTNVLGTYALLEALREHNQNIRLLHVSTDEVFGDLPLDAPSDAYFNETSPYRPSNPYSASKAASDHLVRAWGRTYGMPYVVTHCTNNYGPEQSRDKLIPSVITQALAGIPITIHGDGSNTRDWIHVSDHVEGLTRFVKFPELMTLGGTFCFSSGEEISNLNVGLAICAELNWLLPREEPYEKQIVFVSDRPGNDLRYSLSSNKARRAIGFAPQHDFLFNLRHTVNWYLENPQWQPS